MAVKAENEQVFFGIIINVPGRGVRLVLVCSSKESGSMAGRRNKRIIINCLEGSLIWNLFVFWVVVVVESRRREIIEKGHATSSRRFRLVIVCCT